MKARRGKGKIGNEKMTYEIQKDELFLSYSAEEQIFDTRTVRQQVRKNHLHQ